MDLRENKGLTPVESGFPISAVTIDLTKRCNLACDYCNPAGTPILMADLTYKAIEDIKVGDKIIGFVTPEEKYKHTYFTESVVEAKMERDADLVEVHTSNGVFKCTPDHKWFNGRSYVPAKVGGKIKYVSDPVSFKETDSYKIGYIHGMMVCDGCFSDGIHEVKSGPRIGQMKKYKHVRLALNDIEPIDRIERYLSELGLPSMNRFQFTEEMTGLRSSNIDLFDRLAGIPHDDDTLDYVIGWTAGIFDAEGSYDGYNLRISQLEGEVLDGIIYALESLGFDIAYEDYHDNGVRNIRIENGYSDVIKFFAMCNPCIERKKEKVIVGKSVYGNSEILDIIPAGHDKVYSMQTSTHNYIAHGHTSRNCFAHCFNKDRDKADLKPELGKQIIGWLMREDVRGDNKHLSISFWGGEPLLKFDLMKELILYAEDKAKELGLTLEFGGTTNVTLLTEDKLDFLTEHKCYFLLSIDGRPEHHDMHRKLANGQGSYELVDKNLDAILRKWPNAKVRLSHSVETIDTFLDNLKFLYNRGFRDIAYSPVSEGDWNEERLQVLQKVWTDIADWYIERFQAGDPVHLKFLEDACGQYYGMRVGDSSPCGAGRGYVGITVDGGIYPCHRFNKFDDPRPWYEREVCLGHVEYGVLNQEWRRNFTEWNTDTSSCDACKKCEALHISCNGGCWATNWDLHGVLSAPTEPSCTSVKINMKLAAEIDKKLGEKFKERFIGPIRNDGCVCYNVWDQPGTPYERGVFNRADKSSCLCYNARYNGGLVEDTKNCDCKSGECNGECGSKCNCEEDEELKNLRIQIAAEEKAIREYLKEQEKKMLTSQLGELTEIRKAMELQND